jgi:hypothetical protein
MTPMTRYSLARQDAERHHAQLVRDGKPLPLMLEGLRLEAQLEGDQGEALLLLTEESPYEEGLHVYLIDSKASVVDSMEAGAPFSPAILALKQMGEHWLEFEFFQTGTLYRLYVEPRAALHWPAPKGFKYKTALAKHRLVVKVMHQGAE